MRKHGTEVPCRVTEILRCSPDGQGYGPVEQFRYASHGDHCSTDP